MEEKSKKSIIEEIIGELEYLEAQLEKSGEEFKNIYKDKKTKFAGQVKQYTSELEELGHEKMHDLKEHTEELLELLEADYDLSYTDYEDTSHKLSRAIDKFELKAKEKYENLSKEAKDTQKKLKEEMSSNLNSFKTELDIQVAHFKSTKERASTELEAWKAKRFKDIEDLKQNLEQKKGQTEEKLERFTDEISSSYHHLKQAFKNLW